MSNNVTVIEPQQTNAPKLPTIHAGGAVRAIVPQDFDSAWRIANAVCSAEMAPRGLETPAKAMVAIMHGLEVGLTPMNALQSIAVVNGRPTIYGDGAIGLVRGSGLLEWMDEKFEGTENTDAFKAVCLVKRKGEPKPMRAEFSIADAKKAGLFGKTGPWQQYLKRMLQMRARAFILRDSFADVLKGLSIREEVEDYNIRDVTTREEPPAPPAIEQPIQESAPVVEAPSTAPEQPPEPILEKNPEPTKARAANAMPEPDKDPEAFLKWLEVQCADFIEYAAFEAWWNDTVAPRIDGLFPPDAEEAIGVFRKTERRLAP